MAISKFQAARSQIKTRIQTLGPEILKQAELSALLEQEREQWDLAKGMNGPEFARKLVEAKFIREHAFPFPHRSERRYAKPHVPMLAVLQSLRAGAYYTHASAMQVHEIMTEPVNDIYINFEQPEHERGDLPEQSRIDAAFKGNPRRTNNVMHGETGYITMLNGMQTGSLGVEKYATMLDSEPANIRVTNLERTLIDITVRPYYSGGVEKVLLAFQRSRDRVDVRQLVRYLAKLNYVYPYHQAIGWYMQKSGYSDKQLKALRSLPRLRRFYLTHKMHAPIFDEAWQIFVPSDMAKIQSKTHLGGEG
jgi:hypothetical protein